MKPWQNTWRRNWIDLLCGELEKWMDFDGGAGLKGMLGSRPGTGLRMEGKLLEVLD